MFIPCPYCGKPFPKDQIDLHKEICEEDPIDLPVAIPMTANRARYLLANLLPRNEVINGQVVPSFEIPRSFKKETDPENKKIFHWGLTEEENKFLISLWEQLPGHFPFASTLQLIANGSVVEKRK